MDNYKETFETWDKVASLYQDKFMDLDLYNETYDFICHTITKAGAKILDVGCGPGNITRYLLSARPDFDIAGIDIAPTMIALAKKNNPTAGFTIMDIRQIDKIKTTYDGIICGFCLPYLSHTDCPKLITDCYSLLNEEGLIYISFVEGNPDKSDFKTTGSGDRTFFYYYSLDDLTGLLSKNNFDLLKTFTVGYNRTGTDSEIHKIVIAKKKTTA
ncbi:MAG TPA: class I SAM-dependent methyltransferase [Chitinophagaceae bacterium]|nr:class I SAM-dependent methyltransferase [Chitinophagaceae bacterium]